MNAVDQGQAPSGANGPGDGASRGAHANEPASIAAQAIDNPEPMGVTAARGMSVAIYFALASKVLSVGTQLLLGVLLTQADFGLYSTALAVSVIGLTLRDGGATDWLIQRGRESFEQWIGPVFWLAVGFNVFATVLQCALAPIIAWHSGSSALGWMIVVTAVGQLLGTLGSVQTGALRISLRFTAVATVTGVSAILRQIASAACGVAGFGAHSFTMPLLACGLYESVRAQKLAGGRPWLRRPEMGRWGQILRDTRWLMLNNGASALTNVGDYAVIAVVLLADQRGVYMFAYQIVVQSAYLLAANVTQVMFPTLAALKNSPERFRSAQLRALRALMLATGPTTIGAAAVIAPIEDLVFRGRWDDLVWVVIVGAVLFPPRAVIPLSLSSLMAQGRFRANTVVTVVLGVAMMLGAGVGGFAATSLDQAIRSGLLARVGIGEGTLAGEVVGRAFFDGWATGALGAMLGCGVARAVVSTWGILHAAKLGGVRRRDALDAIVGSWTLSAAALVPTLALDMLVIEHWHPLVRVVIAGVAYSLIWLALTRALLARDLRDLLTAMPKRIGSVGMRLLGLGGAS